MDYVEAEKFPVASLSAHYPSAKQLAKAEKITLATASEFVLSYAEQMILLKSKSFPQIGSLYPGAEPGHPRIGPFVDRMIGFHTKPYWYGPFSTAYDRWTTFVDHQLDLVLTHDGFRGNPEDRR